MAKYFALVPAAGQGLRMGQEIPKQYLPLAGRPMVYQSVKRLSAEPRIDRVYVVLAPADTVWQQHDWSELSAKLRVLFCGGETRAETVLNGLEMLSHEVRENDWILVHDAARPCLSASELARVIDEISGDRVGGLLAIPLNDTLKRAGADGRIESTESRERIWQAQTPQMFRYGLLCKALRSAPRGAVTDEARAVEQLGLRPLIVPGNLSNLKVTYADDLSLAALILSARDHL
jgi:2-C-methyl-D-erythritol 4-phosphate cytidylyltransferase